MYDGSRDKFSNREARRRKSWPCWDKRWTQVHTQGVCYHPVARLNYLTACAEGRETRSEKPMDRQTSWWYNNQCFTWIDSGTMMNNRLVRLYKNLFRLATLNVLALMGILRMYFWPVNVSDVWVEPLTILSESVKSGTPISYEAVYCRYLSVNAEVTKELTPLDPTLPTIFMGTDTRASLSRSNKNCSEDNPDVVHIPNQIDLWVTPLEYYIHIEVKYPVLPWRIITNTYDTEVFTVE